MNGNLPKSKHFFLRLMIVGVLAIGVGVILSYLYLGYKFGNGMAEAAEKVYEFKQVKKWNNENALFDCVNARSVQMDFSVMDLSQSIIAFEHELLKTGLIEKSNKSEFQALYYKIQKQEIDTLVTLDLDSNILILPSTLKLLSSCIEAADYKMSNKVKEVKSLFEKYIDREDPEIVDKLFDSIDKAAFEQPFYKSLMYIIIAINLEAYSLGRHHRFNVHFN